MNRSSRSVRIEQLSQQEKLIEKRKREIEEKRCQSQGQLVQVKSGNEDVVMMRMSEDVTSGLQATVSSQIKTECKELIDKVPGDHDDSNENVTEKLVKDDVSSHALDEKESSQAANKFRNDGSFLAQFMAMQELMNIKKETDSNIDNKLNEREKIVSSSTTASNSVIKTSVSSLCQPT